MKQAPETFGIASLVIVLPPYSQLKNKPFKFVSNKTMLLGFLGLHLNLEDGISTVL
jgi:hypothetical protein